MQKAELVSKAYARYVRVSPRKVKQVIDLIRGEKVSRASAILASINKRARLSVQKALNSAVHNAQQNPAVEVDGLFIFKITADKGPMLKRYRAAAMGRATMIRHRTTHLTVELAKSMVKQGSIKKKKVKKHKVKKNLNHRAVRE